MSIPIGGWLDHPHAAPYRDLLIACSRVAGLTADQFANLIGRESSFNIDAVNQASSATGLGQFIYSTAAAMFGSPPVEHNLFGQLPSPTDPRRNPTIALVGAAILIRRYGLGARTYAYTLEQLTTPRS